MKSWASDSLAVWMFRYSLFVWIGIALNVALIIPLLFCPAWILGILDIPLDQPIWARFAGLLLLIITCYYVPPTIDLRRHRANAWLAILPSRSGGALFFFLAVFAFGQPPGFLVGVLLDGFIGLSTLCCLIRVEALERQQRFVGARP